MDKKIELMVRIDNLIKAGVPGNAGQMAKRLGVNRSTFFRVIGEMRELGAPIDYDWFGKRYVYLDSGQFMIGFFKTEQK